MNVAGVALSHPDRILFPGQGLTKVELARYYEAISPWMLPHTAGRPLSLLRCPAGSGQACFFQKHWSGPPPPGVAAVRIKERGGAVREYTVVHDATGIVALVQRGVLEFHLWGARADRLERPDRLVFDIDPATDVEWSKVREAAHLLRRLLLGLSLECWLKTTGGKGLHVVVPIERRSSWSEVSEFARAAADRVAAYNPERYLAVASKAKRRGRIFIDWLRNTRGATAVAPWSTRARATAPVAAPIAWEDLDRLRSSDQYDVTGALALARGRSDPWAGLSQVRQRLTRAMTAALSGR